MVRVAKLAASDAPSFPAARKGKSARRRVEPWTRIRIPASVPTVIVRDPKNDELIT
jgi:hypothetical protein